MQIVLIGAGKVASSLGMALKAYGCDIVQVYSRTENSAVCLAQKLNSSFTTDIKNLQKADIYFVCLTDDSLSSLSSAITEGREDSLFIHTAGSVNINVFQSPRRGVMWPLQTFSKDKIVDFSHVPLFIEASSDGDLQIVKELAASLSDRVYSLSSEERKYIHLSAVFCNNFSNHCYAIAESLLKDCGVPFDVMLPIIEEATKKIYSLSPKDCQSGPASRNDENTMSSHIKMLEKYPEYLDVYRVMSDSIKRMI